LRIARDFVFSGYVSDMLACAHDLVLLFSSEAGSEGDSQAICAWAGFVISMVHPHFSYYFIVIILSGLDCRGPRQRREVYGRGWVWNSDFGQGDNLSTICGENADIIKRVRGQQSGIRVDRDGGADGSTAVQSDTLRDARHDLVRRPGLSVVWKPHYEISINERVALWVYKSACDRLIGRCHDLFVFRIS
jgi:hypothetical protein